MKGHKWSGVLYAAIIALLFIPLAFMGSNVFFEEKEYKWEECVKARMLDGELTDEELVAQDACNDKNRAEQEKIDDANKVVKGYKYVFVTLLSLIALLVALFAPVVSFVQHGLFVGAVLSAFFSTWTFFESRSIPGFITLVVIFIFSIVYVNRKK